MPPTFLIYLFIYLFVVYVLPVLLVLGIVFALGYGVYRWRQRPGRRAGGGHNEREQT